MNDLELINLIKKEQVEIHDMNKSNSVIKNNIINLAQKKNIKQIEIAKAINMQPSNFSRALNSEGTNFNEMQIKEIAKFLEVNHALFYQEFTHVEIVGSLSENWVIWNKPYQESNYLQLSSRAIETITAPNNDCNELILRAISVSEKLTFNGFKMGGSSATNQFYLFDSNRTKVMEDCHGFLCIIDVHKDKMPPEKVINATDSTSFIAEVILEGNYVLCAPYYKKFKGYKIKKDHISLCSPIFWRTMHKNIVKKASEIKDIF